MSRRYLAALWVLFLFGATARAQEGSFDSNGVKICYSVRGRGEPVLLIHGFVANAYVQWNLPGITDALARQYLVIAFDCRGHGRSGKPHDPRAYGMEMVEDAVRLLDHLRVRRAHVVGYSMGGFVALKLAVTHPERLLTVTSGGAGWPKKMDTALLDEVAESLEAGNGIGPLLRYLTPAGQPQPTEDQLRQVARMVNLFNDRKALAAVIRGMKGFATAEGAADGLRIPTLAIVGEDDPMRAGVDEMKGRWPHLEVVVIGGADHMNAFLQPEFTSALKAFLARHRGEPESAAPVQADTVLVNGKIWTVNKEQPEAEALAVWHGRVVAVGSDAEVRRLEGKGTRRIDLKGRRVLPGFHDSHVHLLGSGQRLSEVALKDAADEAEFGRRVREFDRKLPRDRWLLGGEWDHDRTFGGKLPTAALLDKYVPDRPAFLRRYDGHMAVVNTRALRMAGITDRTADPTGGVIYRREGTREPTGLLRDNAMDLVARLVPEPSEAQVTEAVRAALDEARRAGVTSVEDMDGSDANTRQKLLRTYQRLARAGQLTLRVDLYTPLPEWESLARLGITRGFGDEWVRVGGVKGFADGSLGSSTAKFFEPYLNEPGSTGIFVTPLNKMKEYVAGADRAGLSVAVHSIGDRANAEMLDIFAEVAKENGPRDRRFRIEHAQHLRPQDFPRFRELGVIASLQPYHLIDDGRWAEGRIGAERCASSYANRSLLDAGVRVAFGSDWSVAPLSPVLAIDAAVNRRTLDGKHPEGWFPGQKVRVAEAVEAYTMTAAYAAFQEREKGSLAPGKLADLVVLSRDILADGEKDHIAETDVVLTMVGGRVVFERND